MNIKLLQVGTVGKVLVFIVFLISCAGKEETSTLPFYNTPDFTPEWIDEEEPRFGDIHQIGEFRFMNQSGEFVDNKTFDGKIYITDFFFTTCPGICPKMTGNLSTIQEAFRNDDDVLILSHSVTPWVDTVGQLQTYASLNEIDPEKWHLVTGDADKIYEMARKYYFAERSEGYNKSSDEFLHTENFLLIDHLRRIRGIYNGTLAVEMDRLMTDIHTLKRELAPGDAF